MLLVGLYYDYVGVDGGCDCVCYWVDEFLCDLVVVWYWGSWIFFWCDFFFCGVVFCELLYVCVGVVYCVDVVVVVDWWFVVDVVVVV